MASLSSIRSVLVVGLNVLLKRLLVGLNHVSTIWLTTENRCLLDPWKLDPFLCVVVAWNRQMCDDLCRWKMHRGLFLTDKALVFSHNMTSLQLGLTVTRRIFHSLRLNQAFPQLAAFLRTHNLSWRWEESFFSLDFLVLTLSLEIAD